MRILRSIAGILAAVMFMLSVVSGLSFADNIVIADENVDPETGLEFCLLDDGTYAANCFENPYAGELVIPSEFNGKKVSAVGQIWHCENITSIIISEGINAIDNMAFFDCENLKEVYIPKSVERIKYGNFYLYGCNSLENVYIAEDNEFFCSVDGVVYTKDKTSLMLYPSGKPEKNYTVPDFVTTLLSDSFYSCNNLVNVTIPEGIVKLEPRAFDHCENLETINIPASVIEFNEDAICICPELNKIVVDEENSKYCSADGVLFSKDMTQLLVYPEGKLDEEYTVPTGVTSMKTIKNDYTKCLSVPEGVKRIERSGIIGSNYHDCNIEGNNLKTVILPKSLECFHSARTSCINAEIIYGGTVDDWYALFDGVDDGDCSGFTIICSDGVIENDNHRVTVKEPATEENEDGSVDFTAGITEDVADETNKLPKGEVTEIKQVIENIIISTPSGAGFDTGVELYVTPNVTVPLDFGDRRMTLDLTFKNSDGDEVQPQTPVTVRIPVPERLKYSSAIYVYHVSDDGKAEKIEAVTETIDNIRYVIFETDGFSTYVLTDQLVDNKDDTNKPTTSEPTTSEPNTSAPDDTSGDTSSSTSEPTSSDTNKPDTSEPSSGDTSGTDMPAIPDKPSSPSASDKGQISKDVQTGENAPKTEIITPNGTLMEAVLTADEQEQLKNGVDIGIILRVNAAEKAVSDTDKAIAEEEMRKAGYKHGLYLDLKLFKTIGGKEIQIDKTNAPITISFEIPESLRGTGKKYAVVRVHNGKADILNDYSDDENTIMIRTDKFSTYVLVYSEKSSGISNTQPVSNPNTGNNSHAKLFFFAGIASLFIFIVLCLFTGKNGMTEEEKERKFAKLISWGKGGGKARAAIALTVIFLLLSFYYGIGMKKSAK